jgi:hypothetical protein
MRILLQRSSTYGAKTRTFALVLPAALLSLILGGCSSTPISSLPKELGGLPADTPAAPATKLAYPAVHDMPPPRSKAVMTEDQLKQAEDDLVAARDGKRKSAAKPAGSAAADR